MNFLEKNIRQTLVYADIFDYPLTSDELYKFFINSSIRHSGERSDSRIKAGFWTSQNDEEMLKQVQHDKNSPINTDGKLFFLKGREKIVGLRKKRERWSRGKLKIAQKVASRLRLIPWVKMIGVTGSLAILNSDKDDDIDILIVSERNRLWLTRLLVTILVELTGMRRHPAACHPERPKGVERSLAHASGANKLRDSSAFGLRMTTVKDKICLNMFLDEDHLTVPEKERDLYAAHEVVQMKPLWDKDDTYQKFLKENQWVGKYLPNTPHITHNTQHITLTVKNKKMFHVSCSVFNYLENLVKNFQLWYMRKRRTTEVISHGTIRFHPQDAREWILKEYNARIKKLYHSTLILQKSGIYLQ